MNMKEDKRGDGKTRRQAWSGESGILLIIVIVSVVIILCSGWHLYKQKDNEPCPADTVLVEHVVCVDTVYVEHVVCVDSLKVNPVTAPAKK